MTRKPTVKQFMKVANITQKQLAERLGVGQSTISQFLNPTSNPRLSTLRKLSKELGVSLETLAATYNDADDCDRTDETN